MNAGNPNPLIPAERSSHNIVQALKADEAAAWRRLLELYGPLVYHWCRRLGLQSENAADVGQEVFQSVVANIASFRHDRKGDTFRGWLWTITRNKVRDYFRQHRNELSAAGGTDAQMRLQQVPNTALPADETSISSESGSLFVRALECIRAEFNESAWRAFWRAAVDEDRTADIAADLGMTAIAVRKAKSRVLLRLREELGDLRE